MTDSNANKNQVAGAEGPFFLMYFATGAQPASLRRERVDEIVRFMYKEWVPELVQPAISKRFEKARSLYRKLYRNVSSPASVVPKEYPLITLS